MHKTIERNSRWGLPILVGHYRQYCPYAMNYPGGADRLLMFTLRGVGEVALNGRCFEVKAGDIAMYDPHVHRNYRCVSGVQWEFLWVHINPRPNLEPWFEWPVVEPGLRCVHIGDASLRLKLKRTFFRCCSYAEAGSEGFDIELAFIALEEFVLLVARYLNIGARRSYSAEIRRVCEHLALNWEKQQSVPALARIARLSPSRFAARFKMETGQTPISYLIQLRLHHAARLLEIGSASVKDAAAQVGFQSPFYFSRQFKRLFGISPLQYKQRALQPLFS